LRKGEEIEEEKHEKETGAEKVKISEGQKIVQKKEFK
jgi:hypothetical protein